MRAVGTKVLILSLLACLLLWPALWNGSPLFFPDSLSYLSVADTFPALLGGPPYLFWHRSTLYEYSILPFHWDRQMLWPLLIAQSLLVLFTLRVCVRSRLDWKFSLLVGLLALTTPLPWYVSTVLPDLATGIGILALYAVGLRWGELGRSGRVAGILLSLWAVTAHTTHYLIATGLLVLCLVWNRRGAARIALLLITAVFLQLALNYRLYHRWGLQVEAPPFLLARMLDDGPMAKFLKEHGEGYALHGNFEQFPRASWHILWAEDGLVNRIRADRPDIWERVRREELPLALDTIRTYPLEQLRVSARNVLQLLCDPSLGNLVHWYPITSERVSELSPQLAEGWRHSRQAHKELDEPSKFRRLWLGTTYVVYLLLAMAGFYRAPRRWKRLAGWCLLGILFNAGITASLSAMDGRYHARAVWLLALLAWNRFFAEDNSLQVAAEA